MPIMKRGETICQEETEPDPRAREREAEEAGADALAQLPASCALAMETAGGMEPDADACKAVDLGLCVSRLRKKTHWNSGATRCRQN